VVRVEWEAGPDGRIGRLAVSQQGAAEAGIWPQAVKLLLANADGTRTVIPVRLESAVTEVEQAKGLPAPRFVFANEEDLGYGLFLLDSHSRAALLRDLEVTQDGLGRALLWDALWEAVRLGELRPEDWIDLCLRELRQERDELTVASELGYLQTALRWYLPEQARAALAPRVEEWLMRGMLESEALSLRIAYFRAFAAIAQTDQGRSDLADLLSGRLSVPGLRLGLGERFRILRMLLAQADPRADALLQAQLLSDASDDARRFAWAVQAARPDAQVKRAYFDAFLQDLTLPERWVEEALLPFNTVEHEALTGPFLGPALRALPQLKRTRRIFFVNRWLEAFIGGQRRAESLAVVQRFADDPALDPDLRRKVLEAMDGLERTVRIRGRDQ
jgi:aminopeptidase N